MISLNIKCLHRKVSSHKLQSLLTFLSVSLGPREMQHASPALKNGSWCHQSPTPHNWEESYTGYKWSYSHTDSDRVPQHL